jgi:hypothetical protein
MKIIPAIDIIDGKCVRLSKGDYDTKKIYNENPLEVAKEFESFGINIFIWWILTVQNLSILLTKKFWKPLQRNFSGN